LTRPRAGPGLLLVVLPLLASLVYLPTLRYGFVWDDRALVVDNPELAAAGPVQFFSQSFTHWWAKRGLGPHAYYRPLVVTSLWVDRQVWGPNPTGFHLTNVLWNSLATTLAVLVLAEVIGWSWPALLAGLAFALLPVHVESVAFVSGRTDIMMTVFVLLAMLALVRYRQSRSPWTVAVTASCFGLALLCKEAAMLLPVAALMYIAWIRPRPDSGRRDISLMATLVIVALGYLVARAVVLRGPQPVWGDVTALQRVLLVLNGLGRYAVAALLPFWHRLSYPDLDAFALPGWATAAGLATLAVGAWSAIRLRRRPEGLGSGWFLVFLLPACNLFPPGPSFLSERLLYLPSFGAVLAIAAAAGRISRRPAVRRLAAAACVGYVAVMAGLVLARMPEWTNEVALHRTMARENPNDPATHTNLARVLEEAGERQAALEELRRAAELQPRSAQAWLGLAEKLKQAGDLTGAEQQYRRAIAIQPDFAAAYDGLATLLLESGRAAEAAAAFREAVRLSPEKAMSHNNLGVALQQTGATSPAEAEFRRALELRPGLALAHNNLGELLLARGDVDEAEVEFGKAISGDSTYALAHFNLGVVLERRRRWADAEQEYRRTAELAPDFPDIRDAISRASARRQR